MKMYLICRKEICVVSMHWPIVWCMYIHREWNLRPRDDGINLGVKGLFYWPLIGNTGKGFIYWPSQYM